MLQKQIHDFSVSNINSWLSYTLDLFAFLYDISYPACALKTDNL